MDQSIKEIIEEIANEVVKKLRQPYQTPPLEKPRTSEQDAEYNRQREIERRDRGQRGEPTGGHK